MSITRRDFLRNAGQAAGATWLDPGGLSRAVFAPVVEMAASSISPVALAINAAHQALMSKLYDRKGVLSDFLELWQIYYSPDAAPITDVDAVFKQFRGLAKDTFSWIGQYSREMDYIRAHREDVRQFFKETDQVLRPFVGVQESFANMDTWTDCYNVLCARIGLTPDAYWDFAVEKMELGPDWSCKYNAVFGFDPDEMPSDFVSKLCDSMHGLADWFDPRIARIEEGHINHEAYRELLTRAETEITSWLPGLIQNHFSGVWQEILDGEHEHIREKIKMKPEEMSPQGRELYYKRQWDQLTEVSSPVLVQP